jgi:HlyD family secretion protein
VKQEVESFSITRMFMPRFPRGQRGKNEGAADGKRTIYVLKDGAPSAVKIKAGATDGKATVVIEGDLKVDDPVVVSQKQAK